MAAQEYPKTGKIVWFERDGTRRVEVIPLRAASDLPLFHARRLQLEMRMADGKAVSPPPPIFKPVGASVLAGRRRGRLLPGSPRALGAV